MTNTNYIIPDKTPTINLDHLVGRWDVWERMLKKIHPEADSDGCWIWIGGKSGNGYGRVRVDKVLCTAHRVAYVIFNGPIPTGHVLDHNIELCTERACIQPLHMNVITQRQNIANGNNHVGRLIK